MSDLLITRLMRLFGRLGTRQSVEPTPVGWIMLLHVTPTDRPESVHICCVIEVFDGVFRVVSWLLNFLLVYGFSS